jgi:hypothetical protein
MSVAPGGGPGQLAGGAEHLVALGGGGGRAGAAFGEVQDDRLSVVQAWMLERRTSGASHRTVEVPEVRLT